MAIVRMSLEEVKRIMTPERRAKEVAAMNSRPIIYDPDCPPCSEQKLAKFRRVHPEVGNPQSSKSQIA